MTLARILHQTRACNVPSILANGLECRHPGKPGGNYCDDDDAVYFAKQPTGIYGYLDDGMTPRRLWEDTSLRAVYCGPFTRDRDIDEAVVATLPIAPEFIEVLSGS